MTGAGDNNGQRQPNFLQKLYAFLALSPHPCPEVIYWASDSRQLVIAHPDRLAKEVLPKLFKHDKLASFGRQLNIYGFSRLFPGRQFKDASGNVSNASVWAHPTLHRLSTPEDLSTVKRRAPPKLVRTRRLANGDIVRTRAGPAVLAKAKEVREVMREGRRKRADAWAKNNSNDNPAFNIHEQSEQPATPIAPITTMHRLSAPSQPEMPQSRLPDIPEMPEGQVHRIAQAPPSPQAQPPTMMFHSQNQSPADLAVSNHPLSLMSPPLTSRLYHSAPASIQTSPGALPSTIDEWRAFLAPSVSLAAPRMEEQRGISVPRHGSLQIDAALANTSIGGSCTGDQSIATPAADPPTPFSSSIDRPVFTAPYVNSQSLANSVISTPLPTPRFFGSVDSTSSAYVAEPPFTASTAQLSTTSLSGVNDDITGVGMRRDSELSNGTIDPRWISPAQSGYSTPSFTASASPMQAMDQGIAHQYTRNEPLGLDGSNLDVPFDQSKLFQEPMVLDDDHQLVPPPFNCAHHGYNVGYQADGVEGRLTKQVAVNGDQKHTLIDEKNHFVIQNRPYNPCLTREPSTAPPAQQTQTQQQISYNFLPQQISRFQKPFSAFDHAHTPRLNTFTSQSVTFAQQQQYTKTNTFENPSFDTPNWFNINAVNGTHM
ncbi:hypothetical protein L202_03268 [Cryptococcus amylolentus CBS 6039]|uniref:HSF-type DNA-binding domain-containing protein n=2 Tax=Cryptococcus amylolentus TaxID=104669 RepID=A0A1E3HSA9_9TREE|nr:hypothetical protein L202_03268 [Cryptococcus amylolentus CBS 6039]ODN79253.1 hypothetical protein L202_03268 [Cryptococcus amylolentus CBS 6039]ODO07660.1 hypothetical protein I350_03231 [Cryptococcus amylolentus CBS 6273]